MAETRIVQALSGLVGQNLAEDLAGSFIRIRQDFATKTLERASPGKFVETFVQCLQRLSRGSHDNKPNVDVFLGTQVESKTTLPEGLRICAARIARSIYTLRNKRSIAHKNEVDPNTYDLAFVHQAAAWIMAELIRNASGITMQDAGALIELVQAPVGPLVEDIDGSRLVHADVTVRAEILILLHSYYPQYATVSDILGSMKARSSGSIRNRLGELCREKFAHGDGKRGYRLTVTGYAGASDVIRRLQK